MNTTRLDVLISRAVDGECTEREWRELEAAASADPSVWRNLAQAQRDHALMCGAMESATTVADSIELPHLHVASGSDSHQPIRLNRFGAWTGWAVAALVAVVATARLNQTSLTEPTRPIQEAGIASGPIQSAAQAFQAYLDKGKESGEVVGEMPGRVLVNTRPSVSGSGYEVIYLRQVMERTVVPDLYQVTGRDEAGRPTLVRYSQPADNSM